MRNVYESSGMPKFDPWLSTSLRFRTVYFVAVCSDMNTLLGRQVTSRYCLGTLRANAEPSYVVQEASAAEPR